GCGRGGHEGFLGEVEAEHRRRAQAALLAGEATEESRKGAAHVRAATTELHPVGEAADAEQSGDDQHEGEDTGDPAARDAVLEERARERSAGAGEAEAAEDLSADRTSHRPEAQRIED